MVNTIKLHVQFFLRMNTWLFETCRRQYNWIKSLLKKRVFFLLRYLSGTFLNSYEMAQCHYQSDHKLNFPRHVNLDVTFVRRVNEPHSHGIKKQNRFSYLKGNDCKEMSRYHWWLRKEIMTSLKFCPLVYVGIYHCTVQDWVAVQDIFVSVHTGAGVAQSVKWLDGNWRPAFHFTAGIFHFALTSRSVLWPTLTARSAMHEEKLCFTRTWEERQTDLSLSFSFNNSRGSSKPKIFIASWPCKPRLFSET